MKNDKYIESVKFIESLLNNPGPNFLQESSTTDRSFFIKRLKYLLKLLGNPEKFFKYIHVAGTSGKSSLTAMLQSILTESGIKTGAYFSPHPTTTIERIKTGENYISPSNFAKLTDYLKPYLSECAAKSPHGAPSYFETLLALALLYFKQKKCEYVVLETGLGGAFDATNVIPKPEIAVITNIDLDHTDILGKTKTKIAKDKAGIIKKGSTFITGEQDPKILKIFKKICKNKKSKFQKIDLNYEVLKNDITGTKFRYQDNTCQTKLPGEHQIKNAILAIEAVRELASSCQRLQKIHGISPLARRCALNQRFSVQGCGSSLGRDDIGHGLRKAFLPCRLEIIQHHPTVILDGAHNPDKMKTTAEFIKNIKPSRLHLIIALAENKDLHNTLKYIVPLASRVYLTRFLIPGRKSQDLKKMHQSARKLTKNKVSVYIDPWQALDQALRNTRKNDIVLVTGSFFLAGELRKYWMSEDKMLSSN
ncbi:hypothetical protein KKD19_01360 [Patescibacteria group bacterium]|nr:hypothetical protein [Patescibacteria group bacterium]MBU4511880.1 hypothetical protein [Patescibacteria group bacterium]